MSQAMLLLAAAIVAGAVSVLVLGQDANWDLQNYHFYNAWAYVHDRLGWDLAPAQLQTFHNPLVDLPFYAMVAADWPPRWISFALALPAGIGAFFIYWLGWSGSLPLDSTMGTPDDAAPGTQFGLLAWATLIGFVWNIWTNRRTEKS